MPTQVQVRGAANATQSIRTLVSRELDVDTTNKRINIHDGSTAGGIPHLNYVDAINQTYTYASATGTNAIAMSLAIAPASYTAGQAFKFKAANTITGSATLNVNSLGAKTLKKKNVSGGTLAVLEAGDIIQGGIYTAFYDGTDMILESIDAGGGGMVLVDTASGASPSLSLDASIEGYEVRIKSLVNSTASSKDLYMHLRRSSSSIGFEYFNDYWTSSGGAYTNGQTSGNNQSNIKIGQYAVTASTNYWSGVIQLPNIGGTDTGKSASWNIDCISDQGSLGYHARATGSCSRRDANAYDEITFSVSGGAISSCDIELWGYQA